MSGAAVRALLARHGLRPSRERGQNFLVSATMAERLCERAGIGPADTVLEIGTGLGALTRALAERAARVVTLEVDAGLVRVLREPGALPANVRLLHADVLRADLEGLAREAAPPVRLVANLPYSICGPVLRRLLDLREVLVDWSVLVQREVALRLVAVRGREYGSLTVLHALVAKVERCMDVDPRSFHPAPAVRSTFLRIAPHRRGPLRRGELAAVESVVRAAFSTRRKTLVNALSAGADSRGARARAWLARAGLDERARAETLAPEQFLALARELGG